MPSLSDLKATEPQRAGYLSEESYVHDRAVWQATVATVIERITALLPPPAGSVEADDEDDAAERRGFQVHRYGAQLGQLISSTLLKWEQRSTTTGVAPLSTIPDLPPGQH